MAPGAACAGSGSWTRAISARGACPPVLGAAAWGVDVLLRIVPVAWRVVLCGCGLFLHPTPAGQRQTDRALRLRHRRAVPVGERVHERPRSRAGRADRGPAAPSADALQPAGRRARRRHAAACACVAGRRGAAAATRVHGAGAASAGGPGVADPVVAVDRHPVRRRSGISADARCGVRWRWWRPMRGSAASCVRCST